MMAAMLICVSLPHLLLLLVLAGSRVTLACETVDQTCAKATSAARHKDLASFCVSSVQWHPTTMAPTRVAWPPRPPALKALERRGVWSQRSRFALAMCRQRYIEALNVVHSTIHALTTKNLRGYVSDMEVVEKAATDCEHAFSSAMNGMSPLRKVDENVGSLVVVAMLIVRSLR